MRAGASVVGLAVVLAGCGLVGPGRLEGTVLEPADGNGMRQGVLVALADGAEVAGATEVLAGFRVDELACLDGEPVDPTYLVIGDEISFERVGDEVDLSSPPGIPVQDVRVDCAHAVGVGTVTDITDGGQLLVELERLEGFERPDTVRLDVAGPFRCATGGEIGVEDALGLPVRFRSTGGGEDSMPPGLSVTGVVVLCPPPPEAEG